jgi:hypothetical protein
MRVAVSGTHNTGKSTLIAAFLAERPQYAHEPEAYEAIADDVALTESEGPTAEGLERLLHHTVSALAGHDAGACVVFERSPVDYLAYAAASRRTWSSSAVADFLGSHVPGVRAAMHNLDLIVLVPLARNCPIPPRPDEDERFRRRVDEQLRRALIDDEYHLFGDTETRVVELPAVPEQQVTELLRLTSQK